MVSLVSGSPDVFYAEWVSYEVEDDITQRYYVWDGNYIQNYGFLGDSRDDAWAKNKLVELKFRKDTSDTVFSFVFHSSFSSNASGCTAYLYKTNVMDKIQLNESHYSYTVPSSLGVYAVSINMTPIIGRCTFSNIDVTGMPDEFSLYVLVTTTSGGMWADTSVSSITMPPDIRIQPMSGTLFYTGSNAEIICTPNGNDLSLKLSVNADGSSPFWQGTVSSSEDIKTLTVTLPESIYDSASTTATSVKVYLLDTKLGKVQEIYVYPGGALSPTISAASTERVQSSKTSWATQYIAGYTSQRIKVNASDISTKKNATVSKVEATIQNRTYTLTLSNGVYSCTSNVLSAIGYATQSVVTVTDSRGAQGKFELTLPRVYEYSPPVLITQEAYRCDSRGIKGNSEDNFAYYRVRAKATITSLSGNSIQSLKCQVIGDSAQRSLSNDVISSPLLLSTGAMNYKLAYTIEITVSDRIASTTIQVGLAGLKRDFIVSRKNGATKVGIGTTPQDSGAESSVEMESGGQLIIGTGNIHTIFSDNRIVLAEGKTFGTTAQRNSISSPAKGQLFFNTSTGTMQIYTGTSWIG